MNRTSPHYCRRSVLSLLISALIYAPPGMTAFTPDVIGVVNDETVDGSQRVDERGTTNNTHIINHGQQNVHGGVSNGSLIESGGYQDVGSHNNFVGQANNTTINGGRQTIHDGGISTGTIIDSGNQDVYTGGISNGTTIKGGNSHCRSTSVRLRPPAFRVKCKGLRVQPSAWLTGLRGCSKRALQSEDFPAPVLPMMPITGS